MSNYARNKAKSRTINNQPTETDQSAAKLTDRHLIVQQARIHGQIPTGASPPMYGDFTGIPDNLLDMLKQARSIRRLQNELPAELRNLTINELMSLTPEHLRDKLKKPEPPATPPAEPPAKKE